MRTDEILRIGNTMQHHEHGPRNALLWGLPIQGDLYSWIVNGQMSYPERELGQHVIIIGQSGVGKTETVLRLAAGALQSYGWQVIFLDAKGDYATAARFFIAMQQFHARSINVFPTLPYNGWRGDSSALLNRLMAVEDYSEPYYKNIAKLMLTLALNVPENRPQNSRELLHLLHKDRLLAAYQGEEEAYEIEAITPRDAAGVFHRYRSFFAALHGQLDGTWSFDDAQAIYIILDGLALKEESNSLSRFLIEDFAHYVSRRKSPQQRVLFIIDEFSAISFGTDAANLFERIRSYGASVIVTSQSYEGLGKDADRMLGAATGIILHQSSSPEKIINRAGTKKRAERSHQLDTEGTTGGGSMRVQDTFRVDPNTIRQLGVGEAVIIAHGHAHRLQVERLHMPSESVVQVEAYLRSESLKTPERQRRPRQTPSQQAEDEGIDF